jgi:hypothetical protein
MVTVMLPSSKEHRGHDCEGYLGSDLPTSRTPVRANGSEQHQNVNANAYEGENQVDGGVDGTRTRDPRRDRQNWTLFLFFNQCVAGRP